MSVSKVLWIGIGIICMVLGSVGILLPVLPTVPFYMATVVCFAKGSQRLHRWFISTTIYKKYLEEYLQDKTMTMGTKCKIFLMVTLMMGFGFFMMDGIVAGRAIVSAVWIAHLWMLFFHIPTREKTIAEKRCQEQQVVEEMIRLYCRRVHFRTQPAKHRQICGQCQELIAYSQMRSEKCPFMAQKTFCSNCKVHCYQPAMREKIREIMRFSGPRMLFHHPIMAIRHLLLKWSK